mmetsp:Transcript_38736/g.37074  ORF Transcript_38736/g.37074 Transcript_38736/m.37074 type:complete len:169 (+) Transcript_38736:239-745(+)
MIPKNPFHRQSEDERSSLLKKLNNNAEFLLRIIRVQSIIRGYLSRRDLKEESSDNFKRKYFTNGEFWETIRKNKVFDFSEEREVREYRYKCSEATYFGEFKGGFRDGHGVIKWKDGASYDGDWEYGHATGYGKFTHSIGDVYEGDWLRDKAHGVGEYKGGSSGGVFIG